MGPPLYMRSVVDRNVAMRCTTVLGIFLLYLDYKLALSGSIQHCSNIPLLSHKTVHKAHLTDSEKPHFPSYTHNSPPPTLKLTDIAAVQTWRVRGWEERDSNYSTCISIHLYVCIPEYLRINICISEYLCIYVCVYLYMYI